MINRRIMEIIMAWKCKHCKKEFDFERTTEKANHSRWCKSNPKAKKYRDDNAKQSSIIANNNVDRIYGKKKEYNVKCGFCYKNLKVIEREKMFPKKERYYCNKTCSNSYSSNCYWTEDKVKEIKHDPEFGFKSDRLRMKAYEKLHNKKYKFKKRYCKNCNIVLKSDNRNLYCSHVCKKEYSRRNMNLYNAYRYDAGFVFKLNDYPDKFDFGLIKKYGWYAATNHGNNPNGIVRDHMVSVKYGFDNNIDPKIIGHPANCKLITLKENSYKHTNCSITIEQLLERIKNWG